MMHTMLAIEDAWFARLTTSRPGAAAQVALVIYQDVIDKTRAGQGWRHHDFFSLYFVRQGRGTHVIDGVGYGVARGDVYAMGLGMTHWFSDSENLILDTLHFAPSIFDVPTLERLADTPGFLSLFIGGSKTGGGRWLHLSPDAYAAIAGELAELRAEWESGTPDGILLTRPLFLRLLVHLARRNADAPPSENRPPSDAREATVAAAVRYLDEHFAEPVRMETVAASVFLSPDRLTEVFAAQMGRTPRDYLRHLRLERAKSLLLSSDESITTIAVRSGFGEAAYFARVFRQATGMTPRDWRRR